MIKKILIVDDSPIARKMLRSSIPNNETYEIMEASDGQKGVETFRTFEPDLTFMDLTMPVLSGYEALKEIRKIKPSAVVVVLTADIQPKSISSVMESGAYTVLKKPAQKQSIADTIEKASNHLSKMGEK
jgi:two-component system chemotaxis response regulator CheY